MMKSIGKLTLATILAALVVGVPLTGSAQPTTPQPPGTSTAGPAKPRAIPFHGKLGAVDKTNKTITLDEKTKRTFEITSDTKIMKAGKPATLDDAVVGDDVAGQYVKGVDGKLQAKSVRFGAKPEAPAPAK